MKGTAMITIENHPDGKFLLINEEQIPVNEQGRYNVNAQMLKGEDLSGLPPGISIVVEHAITDRCTTEHPASIERIDVLPKGNVRVLGGYLYSPSCWKEAMDPEEYESNDLVFFHSDGRIIGSFDVKGLIDDEDGKQMHSFSLKMANGFVTVFELRVKEAVSNLLKSVQKNRDELNNEMPEGEEE
jgi:hypothetical protein